MARRKRIPYPKLSPIIRVGGVLPIKKKEYVLNDGLIIRNNQKTLKKKYDVKKIIGFDTETYQGTCKLLCRSQGKIKHVLNPTFLECLDFLCIDLHETTWRFFFNIDFDVQAILKLCDDFDVIDEISKGNTVQYEHYQLKWIKTRMFIIKKSRKSFIFCDIHNIFKDSLQNNALKYLNGDIKDDVDSKRLNDDIQYWNRNLEKIIKYCIKDCVLTEKLGLVELQALKELGIAIPKYLVSPASLSKSDYRTNCLIPKIQCIPEEILNVAHESYHGGHFEILKKGRFKQAWLYDVNSEYQEFIRKCPSFRYGIWIKTTELKKTECIAYYLAELVIPDNNVLSTIPVKYKGLIRFPNGYVKKWLTWYDLDLMREFIIKIHKGYEYVPKHSEYFPYRERVDFHYALKAKNKGVDDIKYENSKITMNAFYGCNYEIHEKIIDGEKKNVAGILYNPVVAGQTTAFGRWKVIKDAWHEREHFIGIHTDSLLVDKELDHLKCSKNIGDWELVKTGECYVIGTGQYQVENLVKSRGIPKKYVKNWFYFCYKHASEFKVKCTINRMLKLRQSIVQHLDIGLVNTMIDDERTISLDSDSKRHWEREFETFSDSLNDNVSSLPFIAIIDDITCELHPNPLLI